MMKLTSCCFEGLQGFDDLKLTDLKNITVLTGPNGAGKSSILQILKLLFNILNKNTPCDEIPPCEEWYKFHRATLNFEKDLVPFTQFDGHFREMSPDVILELQLDEGRFEIKRVSVGQASISFPDPQVTRKALEEMEAALGSLFQAKSDLEKQLSNTNSMPQQTAPQQQQANNLRQQINSQIQVNDRSISTKKEQLSEINLATVHLSGEESPRKVQISEIASFLGCLKFPSLEYVDARQLYEEAVPQLIRDLLKKKKGFKVANKEYQETIDRLQRLIQSDVDLSESEKGDVQYMRINGAEYKKASSGTQISLAFFGLTKLGDPNCIILWDEPENGLHPTRRARLLELMSEDGRQFILATHASEFAPVFSDSGKVFRCAAEYDNLDLRLTARHVADRRSAFEVLEALGVHPARALFTANVIIWVEGPTELLFYRHWLVPRLKKRGCSEGFHFTFMQYGGSLISYLSVADDEKLASTFDLLSLCRHPVVIVDSDLQEDPGVQDPSKFLKPGAARILEEIEKLNAERAAAGLFEWTSGREVENYLPDSAVRHAVSCVWQGYTDNAAVLNLDTLQISQYSSYETALEERFIEFGVTNSKKKGNSISVTAKGKSCWGSNNKVEMMRAALTKVNLIESDLKWGCSSLLSRIEEFVVRCSG